MASLSSLPLPILLLFTFLVTSAGDYLKLPLLRKSPRPSPTQSLLLDIHRLSHLYHHKKKKIIKSPIVSGAPSGSGQYFVELRLGSPPQSLLLVADTGSDLIWVSCSPCKHNCFFLHPPGSIFLARRSSSFSPHHCFDPSCDLIPHPDPNPCNQTRLHSPCRYEYEYSDGSLTTGFFSKETTSLKTSSGKETKLKSLSFGCGFQISGPSVSGASFNGAHGVMGLGRGSISFASQLGRRFGNRFSYCLMGIGGKSGKINWGLGEMGIEDEREMNGRAVTSFHTLFFLIFFKKMTCQKKDPVNEPRWQPLDVS